MGSIHAELHSPGGITLFGANVNCEPPGKLIMTYEVEVSCDTVTTEIFSTLDDSDKNLKLFLAEIDQKYEVGCLFNQLI